MKFKIYEMSYSRNEVRKKFESSINPIGEHLIKIFIHKPSKTDSLWRREVSNFFTYPIRICNNLKNHKRIKREYLIEAFEDYLSLEAIDYIYKLYYNDKYIKMSKTHISDLIVDFYAEYVEDALNKVIPEIVDIMLQGNISDRNKISDILCDVIIEYREKFIKKYKK